MQSIAVLLQLLLLASTARAATHDVEKTGSIEKASPIVSTASGYSSLPQEVPTPRLVIYVQTFTDTMGRRLSLLPLLQENTGVTHIILGSIHLHEEPGKIMLNNEPFNSSIYDHIWKEAKQLQEGGIKVMGLLGGAAGGTYQRLKGDDTTVR